MSLNIWFLVYKWVEQGVSNLWCLYLSHFSYRAGLDSWRTPAHIWFSGFVLEAIKWQILVFSYTFWTHFYFIYFNTKERWWVSSWFDSLAAVVPVSSTECVYRKRLSVDGKQMNLELYDPCSQVSSHIDGAIYTHLYSTSLSLFAFCIATHTYICTYIQELKQPVEPPTQSVCPTPSALHCLLHLCG